ncbi:MAG: hypothetical protein PHU25_04440 [Deltaproteobacteria bacterium]|nr:hypothetical protein [Deltaproteobacteria bacterium]
MRNAMQTPLGPNSGLHGVLVLMAMAAMMSLSACGGDKDNGNDGGTDTGTDTGSDADGDGDSDTNSGSDADTDSDADGDTDTDGDTDGDSDTDGDGDSDTGSDTGTDTNSDSNVGDAGNDAAADAGSDGGDSNFWTIIVLPDMQFYSKSYPSIFNDQTSWIVDQAETLHIAFVLTVGDFVTVNRTVQWQAASDAMHILDNHVPYILATGNHDYTTNQWLEDVTLINDYFPTTIPPPSGRYMENHIENTYYLFSVSGMDWLVVSLQWAPTDEVLDWADGVLKSYSTTSAIIITHAYLYCDSTRYDHLTRPDQSYNPHSYFLNDAGIIDEDAGINDGEEIWQKLVRENGNVRFVFSGHELCGPGFLISNDDDGLPVYQMVARHPTSADGYFRLVEFWPGAQEVRVKTYSPIKNLYKTDGKNQFSFPYAFPS